MSTEKEGSKSSSSAKSRTRNSPTYNSEQSCSWCEEALSMIQEGEKVIMPFQACTHSMHEECFDLFCRDNYKDGSSTTLLKQTRLICPSCVLARSISPQLRHHRPLLLRSAVSSDSVSTRMESFPGSPADKDFLTNSPRQPNNMLAVRIRRPQIEIIPEFPHVPFAEIGPHVLSALLSVKVQSRSPDSPSSTSSALVPSANVMECSQAPVLQSSVGTGLSLESSCVTSNCSTHGVTGLGTCIEATQAKRRQDTVAVLADLQELVSDWSGFKVSEAGKHVAATTVKVGLNSEARTFECHLFEKSMVLIRGNDTSKKTKQKNRYSVKGNILLEDISAVREAKDEDDVLVITLKTGLVRLLYCKFDDAQAKQRWAVLLLAQICPPLPSSTTNKSQESLMKSTDNHQRGRTSSSVASAKPLPERPLLQGIVPSGRHWECESPTESLPGSSSNPGSPHTISSCNMSNHAHIPLDIVIVIPISFCASALDLASLQDAVFSMIASFSDYDRLGVVIYGGSRGTELTMNLLPKSSFDVIRAIFEDLTVAAPVDSGAHIMSALTQSSKIFKDRSARPCLSHVFLLADSGKILTQVPDTLFNELLSESLCIHSFGLGLNHSAKPLCALASVTSGSYTSIRHNVDLKAGLLGCLSSLESIALTNFNMILRLTSSATASSAKILSVGGCRHIRLADDQQSAQISLKHLSCGEQKDFLVKISVPGGSDLSAKESSLPLVEVTAYHSSVVRENTTTKFKRPASLNVSLGTDGDQIPYAPLVIRRLELLVAERMVQVLKSLDEDSSLPITPLIIRTQKMLATAKQDWLRSCGSSKDVNTGPLKALEDDLAALLHVAEMTVQSPEQSQIRATELLEVLLTQRSWQFGLATQTRYANKSSVIREQNRF